MKKLYRIFEMVIGPGLLGFIIGVLFSSLCS